MNVVAVALVGVFGAVVVATAATAADVDASPSAMVLIPAGTFERGRDDAVRADERPRQRVRVWSFFFDEALVTTADFARFVDETGHVTSAEKLGFGMLAVEGMKDWQWRRVPGASWRRPFHTLAELAPQDDWPVTLVSHVDAEAFCRHVGKRLPTEAEWEYAMRAGARTRFPWGLTPRRPDGTYGLNHWQGDRTIDDDHTKNMLEDGHRYLSPVRAFPKNAFGLYDPVGNVWQIVADWYDPAAYAERPGAGLDAVVDPRGPNPTDGDKDQKRVTRGGSWWCSARTCSGFGLNYRGKNAADAPYNNVGFRCAKDAEPAVGAGLGAKVKGEVNGEVGGDVTGDVGAVGVGPCADQGC